VAKKPEVQPTQKFKVLEPKPKTEFWGQGPVIVLDPPQPWGYIAVKAMLDGPIYVNNVTTVEAKDYKPSTEPLLTAAQRFWHLAQQCGMTAEAWRVLQPCLPSHYPQPVTKELSDMTKATTAKTSAAKKPAAPKKAPAIKTTAPKPEAKKPAVKKIAAAEPAPFEGGIPEAEHAASLPPAKKTKAKAEPKSVAPKVEAAKPKAAEVTKTPAPRTTSVSGRIKELLLTDMEDDKIWAAVQKEFDLPDDKRSYIAWNRSALRKAGQLAAK
jgi:hypothetical protein